MWLLLLWIRHGDTHHLNQRQVSFTKLLESEILIEGLKTNTMNYYIQKITPIGLLCILVSCGSYSKIYTNYDKSIDFTGYKTFAWAPDSSSEAVPKELEAYDNDIIRNNAKNYINLRLGQRGMLVNVDSPDLILRLVLLNEKKERIVNYNTRPYGYYFNNPFYYPYYYPYYRYYTWYGWNYPPYWDDEYITYKKTYVKGTITINMYDTKLKKLVWTGSAEGDIYDPAYLQYDVHPAIDRILKKFPIKQVSKDNHNELKFKNRIVRMNGININDDRHFR